MIRFLHHQFDDGEIEIGKVEFEKVMRNFGSKQSTASEDMEAVYKLVGSTSKLSTS